MMMRLMKSHFLKRCSLSERLKMWSPASAILASIVTILASFEAILMYFKACGRSLPERLPRFSRH